MTDDGRATDWVQIAGDYVELSVGPSFVCLVRGDAQVECLGVTRWPSGSHPDMGRDFGIGLPPPGPFSDVVVREYTVCGLRLGGEVDCFGYRGDDAEPNGVFVSLAK